MNFVTRIMLRRARGDCHATVPKPELAERVLTLHSQDPEPQRFQSGQILRGAARRNPPTPISVRFLAVGLDNTVDGIDHLSLAAVSLSLVVRQGLMAMISGALL